MKRGSLRLSTQGFSLITKLIFSLEMHNWKHLSQDAPFLSRASELTASDKTSSDLDSRLKQSPSIAEK